MELHENIKKIRELKNLTQEHVAKELDITQAAYSKIESGHTEISFTKIKAISKVFDISPEQLIAFDSQKYFHSFNNVKGNNNGSVIINTGSDEIKQFYEDKIKLLTELLESVRAELRRYKERFGDIDS